MAKVYDRRGNLLSWEDATSIVEVGRAYGFDVIDYGDDRDGEGFLVSVGSGLMMAVMDSIPSLRYAIDFSGLRDGHRAEALGAFSSRLCTHLAVAAWFTISKPDALLYFLEPWVGEDRVYVYANVPILYGRPMRSLGDLVERVNERHRVPADRVAVAKGER